MSAPPAKALRALLREWLESIALAALLLAVLYFLCWPFKVTGESMKNTLFPGDRIVVSRAAGFFGPYDQGDLVVCSLQMGGRQEIIVKRIAGVPGDRVTISGGQVSLNGAPLAESYLAFGPTSGETDVLLGEGEYFLLGDNRPVSLDSRAVGPVRAGDILGKVLARWFPFSTFTLY